MKDAYKNRDSGEYDATKHFCHLRGIGDALASGEKDCVGALVNVGGIHWVTLALDFRK